MSAQSITRGLRRLTADSLSYPYLPYPILSYPILTWVSHRYPFRQTDGIPAFPSISGSFLPEAFHGKNDTASNGNKTGACSPFPGGFIFLLPSPAGRKPVYRQQSAPLKLRGADCRLYYSHFRLRRMLLSFSRSLFSPMTTSTSPSWIRSSPCGETWIAFPDRIATTLMP